MSTLICGKVAYVLDNGDIVINVGTAHGVHRGMHFDVIDDHGLDIKDPDTEEVIGSLEVLKIKVEVIDTQEKISVAAPHDGLLVRNRASSVYRVSSPVGPFARSLLPAGWVEGDTISLSEKDSNVKIGDSIAQVIEEINTEGELLREDTEAFSPAIED